MGGQIETITWKLHLSKLMPTTWIFRGFWGRSPNQNHHHLGESPTGGSFCRHNLPRLHTRTPINLHRIGNLHDLFKWSEVPVCFPVVGGFCLPLAHFKLRIIFQLLPSVTFYLPNGGQKSAFSKVTNKTPKKGHERKNLVPPNFQATQFKRKTNPDDPSESSD